MKIKSIKKYTTRFKKMAFGGEPDEEVLASHTFFDEKGNLVAEEKIDDEEGILEVNKYTYDASGKMLKHELIMEAEGISEVYEFNRDEKGRLLSEIKYYGEDPGEKTEYTYSTHDQPITIARYDADGEPESFEKIVYNERDLLVEHHKMGPDQKHVETTKIDYNEKDAPVEKRVYDNKDKLIRTTLISYNDKGELVRITEKNGDGIVISDIVSTYDDRGNVIQRKIRDFHSRTLRFEFDENDNCITEEVFDENGNLTMKSNFEFDENKNLLTESGYFMDMNRSAQMANTQSRYEYEYYT